MGIGRSKFPISYEEACHRAGNDVVKRLKETFERYSSNTGLLPQVTFLHDIFGDGMPPKLAEELYHAFHGGQKGIKFNDLLRGLVLLVHGTKDEKATFIGQMLTEEGVIMKDTLQKFIAAVDIDPTKEDLETLFNKELWCSSESFVQWIKVHPNVSTFTKWLLEGTVDQQMSFTAEPDPPTFYETLAKKYGPDLVDRDIMDIEKTYWSLKGSNGKFDLPVLENIICPPLPQSLCQNLFKFLDINNDSHIDLSEMVRGVSLFCRRSLEDRIRVCFKLMDNDDDDLLNKEEMSQALEILVQVRNDNMKDVSIEGEEQEAEPSVVETTLEKFDEQLETGGLTVDQFLQWSLNKGEESNGQALVNGLLNVLFEVCHVRLGLKPRNTTEEEAIIKGYMVRYNKCGRQKGHTVNLISAQWFNTWRLYTEFEMEDYPLSRVKSHYEAIRSQPPSSSRPRPKPKSMSIQPGEAPMADPLPVVIDVPDEGEQGEDVIEGYAHVISAPPSTANSVTPPLTTPTNLTGEDEDGGRPGPIDNHPLCVQEPFPGSKKLISLTNEGGHLLKNLQEHTDYYVIPEDVWRALITWYGTSGCTTGPSLPRMVIDDEGSLELYPIMFQVYKHSTLPPSKQSKSSNWSSFLEMFGFLGFRTGSDNPTTSFMGPSLPGDPTQPVLPRRVLYYTASFDKRTTVQECCECLQKVLHAKPEDLRIYSLTNEDQPELLDEENATFEGLQFRDGQKILVETRNKDNSWPEEIIAVIKDVQSKEKDSEKERERVKSQGTRVPEGATGLSNLGNTCFMNSALQCISNSPPMTTYFREKDHLLEINKQNPLGMKGVMAKRYGELVQDLWSGHHKSITPLKFRFTIAQNAPQFNNFQQQDAQELLSFVLDYLHEDLNRVKVKPYRELADSDDRPIEEVAEEAWEYHKQRNDSIIVDLFQGQLKSVVECKECGHRSIKFDPFTFLSLPLPLESTTNLEVVVVRLDGSQPIRYSLKLELDAKYRLLREELAQLSGVYRILLVDVFGGIVRTFPHDSQKLRTILSGSLYGYEVPPPPPPIVRADSPTEIMKLDKEKEKSHTNSFKNLQEERQKEKENETLEEKANEESTTEGIIQNGSITNIDDVQEEAESETNTESGPLTPDTDDLTDENQQQQSEKKQSEENSPSSTGHTPSPQPLPTYCSPSVHGFIFAVHRRILRMENYFLSTQKNRPVLFSTPMVVPCLPTTPRCDVYECVWNQVLRLIIPDPPNTESEETTQRSYPFKLKMVGRDGLFCCHCPWYRFCRGCPVECSEEPFGDDPHYLAIDWDDAFLHLKYQAALERPKDHESMDALKSQDTRPIDLTDCFAAFSKSEELGEDELWYCKKCENHCPAKKTLEVWKLPPVLIIHIKRFHFHNGRWTKSQRTVNFPMTDLDPLQYTVLKEPYTGLEEPPLEEEQASVIKDGMISVTPPLLGEGEEADPLELPEEGLEDIAEDEKEETPLSEEVIKEEVPVSEEINKEEIHVSEEINKEDVHVSEEINKEDVHVSEEINKEEVPVSEEVDDVSNEEENAQVTFIDDDLQFKPNFSRTTSTHVGARPIYDLFAITCHSGVLGGGHYTAFAKNPNSKWYYYNDSTCKETTENRISSESPYLLFYEARGLSDNYHDYRATQIRHGGGGRRQDVAPADDDDEAREVRTNQGRSGRGSGCRQQ